MMACGLSDEATRCMDGRERIRKQEYRIDDGGD
jgi:hypothetical protein